MEKDHPTDNHSQASPTRTAALHNLGCKVNAYETEAMEQLLRDAGYEIVPFDTRADVYVINTCSVTNMADRKSRQMLSRARKRNPQAVVVAVGCYVQTAHDRSHLQVDADILIGNNKKKDLVEILEDYFSERELAHSEIKDVNSGSAHSEIKDVNSGSAHSEIKDVNSGSAHSEIEDVNSGSAHTEIEDINRDHTYENLQISRTCEHTRAFIKVQDGCNQFCSYCIIPYARGRIRSRKSADVLEEVARLTATGVKEIVLTGIHLSSYGQDWNRGGQETHAGTLPTIQPIREPEGEVVGSSENPGSAGNPEVSDNSGSSENLLTLIQAVASVPGVLRIRLGSLEPGIITEDLARSLQKIPQFCPHFHLSLQSGCDAVLQRMNRKYTTAAYERACELLRKVFDNPALTTDVIVGFPGESEEEFAATKAYLEKLGLYETHIFKYSRRAGTKAASMPDQISEETKRLRSDVLIALGRKNKHAFIRTRDGKRSEVLFEETCEIDGETYYTGYTKEYIRVYVRANARANERANASGKEEEDLTNRVLTGILDCRDPERVMLQKTP